MVKVAAIKKIIEKNQYTILLAVLACVIAAIIYRVFFTSEHTSPGFSYKYLDLDPSLEGFQASSTVGGQSIQDLLDKLKVDIYGKESIWSNQLYREQPDITERPLSIWRPLNETGEPYRLLGHAVTDNDDYSMPRATTMLAQGDTKPPISANKVFEFPHNKITLPNENLNAGPIYKGIRNMEDLESRRLQIQNNLAMVEDTINRLQSEMKNTMDAVSRRNMIDMAYLYGPEGFFQSAATTVSLDEKRRARSFPTGDYNSIRVPVGSKITLQSEQGGTIDITIPLEAVLDKDGNYINDGEGPSIDDFYRYVEGIGKHDFRISGKYCLRARDFYGTSAKSAINNKKNSTTNAENAKSTNAVYMPFHNNRNGKKSNFAFNYRMGTSMYPHNRNGRADIYRYLMDDQYKNTTDGNKTDGKGRVGIDKVGYAMTGEGQKSLVELDNNSSNQMRDALLYRERTIINMDNTALNKLVKSVDDVLSEEWVGGDESLMEVKKLLNTVSSQTIVPVDKYYMDLAFTFQTWEKFAKSNDGFKISYGYTDYDRRGERPHTLEMLYRCGPPNFYGRMVTGAITMLDDKFTMSPELRQVQAMSTMIQEAGDRLIASHRRMLDNLDLIQRDVEASTLGHFPLQIWRPNAPSGYTNLGDLVFNHEDTNYDARQPQLGSVACVPSQCVKAVRDWLPVDKVYEHRNTSDTAATEGSYLAIYRNPYLQTFRVSTQPDILPTGRVEKVVACVEKCRVLDDIIEADKCAQEFYKANKRATESYNLDGENVIKDREGHIYRSRIREREDRINTLQEAARRLQIQDDKAHIVNQEYNRQKFQKLVDDQRHNINTLAGRLDQKAHTVDVNVHFDYDKFQRLLFALKESERIPDTLHDKLQDMVGNALASGVSNDTDVQNNNGVDDDFMRQLLGTCPTPESEGLVLKSLVEAGCYNCANLT